MRVFALKNRKYPASSSGGAFPTIAEAYYNDNSDSDMLVFGAGFNDDLTVSHMAFVFNEGIDALYESKYVRSNISGTFDQIDNAVKKGLHVLFTGTPCQVAAVNKYFESHSLNSDMLLTVDLICHGTPKTELWEKYISLMKKRYGNITTISFRHKKKGQKARTFVRLQDGTCLYDLKEFKTYMQLFSTSLSLHRGCFHCPFRSEQPYRPGDLTIGDFWGVSEILHEFKGMNGVSLVIPNTDKGKAILESISVSANRTGLIVAQCKDEKYKLFNPHLFKQTPIPRDYDTFWKDFESMSIEELDTKYSRRGIRFRTKQLIVGVMNAMGLKYKVKYLIHKMH